MFVNTATHNYFFIVFNGVFVSLLNQQIRMSILFTSFVDETPSLLENARMICKAFAAFLTDTQKYTCAAKKKCGELSEQKREKTTLF